MKRGWAGAPLWLGAGLIACLAIARQAQATDGKVAPGSWCIPEDGDQTDFTFYGAINSLSSSDRYAQCPILRDNTTNTDGLDSIYAEIWTPAGQTITCTASTRDASSNVVVASVTKSATGGDDNTLTWDASDIYESASPGYYHLSCKFQGSSTRLFSYRWWEP